MAEDSPFVMRWWHRLHVEVEVSWRLYGLADLVSLSAFRRWLFHVFGQRVRFNRQRRRVFWIRGGFRVFGLLLGAGLYVDLDDPPGSVPELPKAEA